MAASVVFGSSISRLRARRLCRERAACVVRFVVGGYSGERGANARIFAIYLAKMGRKRDVRSFGLPERVVIAE
jgi:hypothetical protein